MQASLMILEVRVGVFPIAGTKTAIDNRKGYHADDQCDLCSKHGLIGRGPVGRQALKDKKCIGDP